MPVSATEWIDSAIIDAEPVIRNAANFATAIPRLARNAAKIARRVPCPLASVHSLGRRVPDHATATDVVGGVGDASRISTGLCLLMWPTSAL